jgi:hypothetical protein
MHTYLCDRYLARLNTAGVLYMIMRYAGTHAFCNFAISIYLKGNKNITMKKFAFISQVLVLLTTLPVLTILEMNHATARPAMRKALEYTQAPEKGNPTCVTLSAMPLF